MPIQNNGTQKYWFNGETFDGLKKAVSPPNTGNQKYWLNGKSVDFLLPTSSPPPATDNSFPFTIAP